MTEDGGSHLPVPAGDGWPATQADRRLGDEETADILARASRQEVRSNLPSPHDPTLDDLVAAAVEAGLDGAAVRRAAAVHPVPESGSQTLVFGGQSSRTVRGVIEGRLPEDTAYLARTAEAVTGKAGAVVKSKQGTWVWESKGGLSHTRVVLTEDAGGTDIAVRGNKAGVLALTYLPLLVGVAAISSGLSLFTTIAAGMGPLVALIGLFGLPLLLTRPLFARFDRGSQDLLEHLTMELIRVTEENGVDPGESGEPTG